MEKPLADFAKHKKAKDGHQHRCRLCGSVTNREWREKNAEKRRAYHAQPRFVEARKAYKKAKPEVIRLADVRRRERRYGDVSALMQEERSALADIYNRRDAISEWTGIRYEVDHIIPLSRGGKHHPTNLQLLTADENRRKGSTIQPRKEGVLRVIL